MARDKALLAAKKAKENLQKAQGIAELKDRMAINDASAESAHPQNHKGSCLALLSYELLI